jgi:hypothetical protein
VLRRKPFALPHAEQLDLLSAVLTGDGPVTPPDPQRFVAAAIAHRVMGACVAALDEGRLVLGDEPQRQLRDAQAVAALRSGLLRRELQTIAGTVAEAVGAEPVVIKGPAIADRFYLQRGLRGFADLDLLVPRERLAPAVDALGALGYGEQVELREGFGESHGHDVHMARPVGARAVDVEVHWRVGDDAVGTALSHEALAGRASAPEPGGSFLYADPSDQLLICAMHLLSDRLKRLAWIEDVRRVATALDEPAWTQAFERARELGLVWVLNRALDYAGHHLGYARARPLPAGEPPPWGPLRAVEELDLRASLHIGRLAALPWRSRPRYVRDIVIPSRAGLRGTVGTDGAGDLRLVMRHVATAVRSLRPGR